MWTALQQPATWAGLAGVREVFDPVFDDNGHLKSYRWRAAAGPRHIEGASQVVRSRIPSSMVLEVDANEVTGTISVRLEEPKPRTTILSARLILEAHGVLASLFFPIVSQAIGEGLPAQLELFARRFSERSGPSRRRG